jgi:hypothetical protein
MDVCKAKRHKTYCQLFKWTGLFDVRKSRLELLQLNVDFLLRFFGFLNLQNIQVNHQKTPSNHISVRSQEITHCLDLECFDSLYMRIHIIRHRLEFFQQFLRFVDDGFILHDRAVVRNVDSRGLSSILIMDELGVVVAFAEGL